MGLSSITKPTVKQYLRNKSLFVAVDFTRIKFESYVMMSFEIFYNIILGMLLNAELMILIQFVNYFK